MSRYHLGTLRACIEYRLHKESIVKHLSTKESLCCDQGLSSSMFQTLWEKWGSSIYRMDGSFELNCKISLIGISSSNETILATQRKIISITYTNETECGLIGALKKNTQHGAHSWKGHSIEIACYDEVVGSCFLSSCIGLSENRRNFYIDNLWNHQYNL